MDRKIAILTLIILISGCSTVIPDELYFTSEPATIDNTTLEKYEYKKERKKTTNITKTINISGEEKEIKLQTHQLTATSGDSVISVYTFPSPKIGGKTILSPSSIPYKEKVIEKMGKGATELKKVNKTQITVFGKNTSLITYSTERNISGRTVTVYAHLGVVSHDGDYISFVGIHPETTNKKDIIIKLIKNIEH